MTNLPINRFEMHGVLERWSDGWRGLSQYSITPVLHVLVLRVTLHPLPSQEHAPASSSLRSHSGDPRRQACRPRGSLPTTSLAHNRTTVCANLEEVVPVPPTT